METKAMEQEAQPNPVTERIIDNICKVIVSKGDAIKLSVVALITGGHILIEGVLSVGKTMLAKSLARSTECTFSKVQLTPGMLLSDITGISVYNQKKQRFEFRLGPVIAQNYASG
jgi:MoxR-like ATPase